MKLRLVDILGVAAILCLSGIVLYPIFATAKHRNLKSCRSRLHQLTASLIMYSGDNDDRLPPRDAWMDAAVQAHNDAVKHGPRLSEEQFRCDVVVRAEMPGIGYAFNSLLDGKKYSEITDSAKTILLYDSINFGRNASDPLLSLPKPGRHGGHNTVAYADGHTASEKHK
jgi:prepilin-type processing-associated H-X9-DG protein